MSSAQKCNRGLVGLHRLLYNYLSSDGSGAGEKWSVTIHNKKTIVSFFSAWRGAAVPSIPTGSTTVASVWHKTNPDTLTTSID